MSCNLFPKSRLAEVIGSAPVVAREVVEGLAWTESTEPCQHKRDVLLCGETKDTRYDIDNQCDVGNGS